MHARAAAYASAFGGAIRSMMTPQMTALKSAEKNPIVAMFSSISVCSSHRHPRSLPWQTCESMRHRKHACTVVSVRGWAKGRRTVRA